MMFGAMVMTYKMGYRCVGSMLKRTPRDNDLEESKEVKK